MPATVLEEPAVSEEDRPLPELLVQPTSSAVRVKPAYLPQSIGFPLKSLAITLVCGFILAAVRC